MTCQQQTIPKIIHIPSEVFELWQELLIALLVASYERKKEENENDVKK
jgi:predicted Na+-dependent transporter